MCSDLFSIGKFTVHSYGLMIAIGVLCAYFVSDYRAKKKGLDADRMFSIMIWALVGGFAGAKILYYLTILDQIIKDPSLLLDISNGFVVYGGILGGLLACFLYCRRTKTRFIIYADLLMPAVALAQGFGRIGCLLAGCCYGLPTSSAFSITFQHSDLAPNGVALIPTQPISSALDFLNFFALLFIAKRTKKPGVVTACYLIFYSLGRFILEFFRGDLIRGMVGNLSTSQLIALVVFAGGWAMLYFEKKRAAGPADTDGSD
jgi:phosphatidylglycerol:prolipoprotein diacylglycerol transferase